MDEANPHLLLIEDNDDDVFIFHRAAKKAGLTAEIQRVADGEEAVAYLAGTGSYVDRSVYPLPSLIFLDLKLPLRHGLDVLAWIQAEPNISNIPVIVLTSSAEPRDIERARRLDARAFLVKPPQASWLSEIVEALKANPAQPTFSRKLLDDKFT